MNNPPFKNYVICNDKDEYLLGFRRLLSEGCPSNPSKRRVFNIDDVSSAPDESSTSDSLSDGSKPWEGGKKYEKYYVSGEF